MILRFTRSALVAIFGLLLDLSLALADGIAPTNSSAPTAADGGRYFAVFLSQQSVDNEIKLSHTFAVFLRATGESSPPRVVETRTISWFPVSEIVSLARPAEPGVNKTLENSLAWAEERGLQITVNGPLEIQPELYRRAAQQAERLNRGELQYKAFDRFGRDKAKNCLHAIADIAEDLGRLNTGTSRGQDGTLQVIHHLQSFFVTGQTAAESESLLSDLKLQRFVAPAGVQLVSGR